MALQEKGNSDGKVGFYCWRSCRSCFAFWWCSIISSTRQAHTILIPPMSISNRMQVSVASEQFYWLVLHLNSLSSFLFVWVICLWFPRIFLFVQKKKIQSYKCVFWYKKTVETLKKKPTKTTLPFSCFYLLGFSFFFFFNVTHWDCRNNLFCSIFSSLFSSCIWQYYLHNQFFSFTVVIPLFMGCSGKLQGKKKKRKLLLRLPMLAAGLRCRLLSGEFSNYLVALLKSLVHSPNIFFLKRFWGLRPVSRFPYQHRQVAQALLPSEQAVSSDTLNFPSSVVLLGNSYSWALFLWELKPAFWLPAQVHSVAVSYSIVF